MELCFTMSVQVRKPVVNNVTDWIENNKQDFLPPVCNKMLHNEGQMKLFFVGGPNQRKDYHIECGEELFYQLKGDMCLKVVEKGQHKDVHIKQGEIFLLPGRIQHSPQRFENTVGLVIERERNEDTEKDGLRYFIEEDGKPTTRSLFERWFYCTDLGSQLAPVIAEYFASEQCRTGQPLPGTIPDKPPLVLDMERELEAPFSLQSWLDDHQEAIDSRGRLAMFDTEKYQFQVYMYGAGDVSDQSNTAEAWIWQTVGGSTVDIEGDTFTLNKDDSLLVPVGKRFVVHQETGSRALVCYQDPTKSDTWPKAT